MHDKFLGTLKAWAGLVGAALTAASGVADMPPWVTATAAALTAVAVYAVPNVSTAREDV